MIVSSLFCNLDLDTMILIYQSDQAISDDVSAYQTWTFKSYIKQTDRQTDYQTYTKRISPKPHSPVIKSSRNSEPTFIGVYVLSTGTSDWCNNAEIQYSDGQRMMRHCNAELTAACTVAYLTCLHDEQTVNECTSHCMVPVVCLHVLRIA